MSTRDKVIEFHRAMDVPVLEKPKKPHDDRIRLRLALIAEEFFELLGACDCQAEPARSAVLGYIDEAHGVVGYDGFDMPEVADALADLVYVIEGTNLEFGIDGERVLDVVHAANMAKANGPRRADGKILKPEGWTPPDVAGELRRQGWDENLAEPAGREGA